MRELYKKKMYLIYFIFSLSSLLGCKKRSVNEETIASENAQESTSVQVDTSYNIFHQLTTDSSSQSVFMHEISPKYEINARGWQGCPSIGYLKGSLYVGYYCGTKGEEPGNYISVALSDDMGKSWKDNCLILARKDELGRNFDPSFWNDKYGGLHLSWTTSSSFWDGAKGGTWQVKVKRANNKITMTTPSFLFNGIMNVKPTISMTDSSKILFPVSGWNFTGNKIGIFDTSPTPQELNGAFVYESTYDAKTKQITKPTKISLINTIYSRTFDEHMIVDLGLGNMICLLRTNTNGTCIVRSADGGRSWTTQEPFLSVGSTTDSKIFFGKLKSGNILLVLNNSTKREKLTAYLSKDNGKTWPFKVLIDARNGVSYPDATENSEGEICLVYDYGRSPIGHVIFAKFSEQDIINGDPSKILKTMVSQIKPLP
ncbi:sialidase family protein [Pedobacter sp. GR22-6]|uniref:sialidase family protein n=1 Tax=Pedobacter sp. GR22-6 TaxID=3127957 RepID=UPI00307F117C